ncbi:MAG: hypothetical protein HS111_07935 [Kofleriaceae bacterium]|nr:hypothetical protein [Kofleriaceae bacterium]MCL4224722.1 hypothetical protein [Myxococcales bacterium]
MSAAARARLLALVDDDHAGVVEIADHLDGLDAAARRDAVTALGRSRQRRLFEKAAHARPVDLAFFVGDAGVGEEVIHDGRNTLPLPPPLGRFQKRFCRPPVDGRGPRLFGYNEGPTRRAIGPGFFVADATAGRPHWTARGPVVIDYLRVPDGPVAAGWPPVVDNEHGLQRFVYGGTRDFMRRVSRHVSIGAAYKGERPLDHYFVLCRR